MPLASPPAALPRPVNDRWLEALARATGTDAPDAGVGGGSDAPSRGSAPAAGARGGLSVRERRPARPARWLVAATARRRLQT